tara:strand:+ start:78 stop:680 length:603 start_codon:yes stop_codon:yes gene_type:complete
MPDKPFHNYQEHCEKQVTDHLITIPESIVLKDQETIVDRIIRSKGLQGVDFSEESSFEIRYFKTEESAVVFRKLKKSTLVDYFSRSGALSTPPECRYDFPKESGLYSSLEFVVSKGLGDSGYEIVAKIGIDKAHVDEAIKLIEKFQSEVNEFVRAENVGLRIKIEDRVKSVIDKANGVEKKKIDSVSELKASGLKVSVVD